MAKKADLEEDDIGEEIDEALLAEDDDVPPEEPEEQEEPEPRGRNTGLTIALCVLNVLAALGFTYLLVVDYQKRQEWSHAVFMNELFLQGLPLAQEDDGLSGSRVTLPHQKLESSQITEVFRLKTA